MPSYLNLKHSVFIALFAFIATCFPISSHASDIENQDAIIFGQTAALKGPAAALGTGMNQGIQAAFKEFNDHGGINGRDLKLISYDDGYEPELAIKNTQTLIDDHNVFALIGGVGTPTANAVQPITSEKKIPFIGAFTGAEFLRSPFKRYVVNVRGSYWQETEEWIERLTSDLGIKRIAILYQDDSYGRAGLSGVQRALAKRGMELVGHGTYKRNTTAVKMAVLNIRKSKPEAVVMIGAYKPSAEFINVSRKLNFNPLFINISFVGSKALAQELGQNGAGVIISQVVPFPFGQTDNEIVQKYQKAITAYAPDAEYGFVSLEGYIVGHFVGTVLSQMDGEITREAFLDKIYDMRRIDLDGVQLTYDKMDNQGMDKVFMTILKKDGSFEPVTSLKK